MPRTALLPDSFQVQVNAIVLMSNAPNPVHTEKVAHCFSFHGLTDRDQFSAFQKVSKAVKLSSNSWLFPTLAYFVVPAEIKRGNPILQENRSKYYLFIPFCSLES